jgi:DNA-binding MarR family transcriptional regulator
MAEHRTRGGHTGKAALIRKMKLRYPELSNGEIAKRVGCDESNVRQVMKRFLAGKTEEDIQTFAERKADIYDAIQMRLLESVTDEQIEKTPVYPRIISAGILEDKARVIRGQPTSIHLDVLCDLLDAVREMRDKR